jgi:choline dehydrogenase-like flavoprotein
MADTHYDVIIIGSGAGGGTLAYRLAPTGKKILSLERGDYVPRERENWDSRSVVVEGRYNITEAWRDKSGKEFHAGAHYYVGGNTKFYGAALLRMRAQDFGEVKHHGGISPEWPIRYDDLEPYYTQAEHLYHVHGNRGEDPTEPKVSAPYKYPALTHEPRIQQLHRCRLNSGMNHRRWPMPHLLGGYRAPFRRVRQTRASSLSSVDCRVMCREDRCQFSRTIKKLEFYASLGWS